MKSPLSCDMCPFHDEAHLESLDLQFVFYRRVSFDFILQAGGDNPRARGQLPSLDLFQAAPPARTSLSFHCLAPPSKSAQSLVAHRRPVVLRASLIEVDP